MHGLCSSYHWSFEQAKKLTVPQVIMLNHAAWLEQKNGDIRYEHNKKVEKWAESSTEIDPIIEEFGVPMSELSETQMAIYMSDWSQFA